MSFRWVGVENSKQSRISRGNNVSVRNEPCHINGIGLFWGSNKQHIVVIHQIGVECIDDW
ncbi:hypothetical protein [Nitrosomonas ureae]|uniref:hypothetical protein n=1 Tax=Nitrosomonas ureae TaxID=44577 RepID=UPI0011AB3197|nr:hypothetical protein [Nitrosomonas ureae]